MTVKKSDKPAAPTANAVSPDPASTMAAADMEKLQAEFAKLQQMLTAAQESERRALADYQNLVRRTQEAQTKMVRMAGLSFVQKLLPPLEHLYLAQQQLKDKGLTMVYVQFQQALASEGLEEIPCEGKPFDPKTMEVVDKQGVDDAHLVDKVMKVTQRGYTLYGEVIAPAKVIIGTQK